MQTKNKRLFRALLMAVVIFVIALPAAVAAAAWDSGAWQYEREIQSETDGFALIDLDQAVMEHALYGFADLRLVDAGGTELPYQLVERGVFSKSAYDARLFDVAVVKGEANILSLDIGESGHLHNRIEMEIAYAEDYLRTVIIEGSDDNSSWKTLGEDRLFRVGKDYEKSYLDYPESSCRYIRLKILTQGEKPLTVVSARVFRENADNNSQSEAIPVSVPDLKINDGDRSTEVIVDLGVNSYQVEKLALDINGRNYQRRVQLLQSSDRQEWAPVADDQIMAYQWDNYRYLHNEIRVGSMCPRFLKIKVLNQDSPPLDIKGIAVWAYPPRIMADLPPGQYSLWYGNSTARSPVYDLKAFSGLIDRSQLPVLTPGPEKLNSAYQAPQVPWTERNKWLLNAVIIAAALALGAAIFKALKAPGGV